MKNKAVLALPLMVAAGLSTSVAQADISLWTTQNDWAQWFPNSTTNLTLATGTAGDTDGSTINGQGNTTSPGGAGTAGALEVTWVSGTYDAFYSPDDHLSSAFLHTISGNPILKVDYTLPGTPSGTYFGLDLIFSYDGHFDTVVGASGSFPNTAGTHTATFNLGSAQPVYSTSYTYFHVGLAYTSNDSTNFSVDNFRAVPEPASLAALGLGALALIRKRRSLGR
jgi:hypothetical protein